MGRWLEVRVRGVSPRAHDGLVRALVAAGSPGVEDLGGELRAHLGEGADPGNVTAVVAAVDPGASVVCADIDDAAWRSRWPAGVEPQRVGRLAVAPPWRAAEIADAELPVVIEPALAFGTGEHESTRGVLRLMQDVIRPGDFVADAGTGSAVLAIAAARLGARRVAAIEIDPQALGNAEENIARNDVGSRVSVLEGDAALLLPLLAPVRVVLANIISSVLLALAPAMRRALGPGGAAVLGGILTAERDAMVGALHREGWELGAAHEDGAWWSCVIAPR